ncbi:hypothetical protein ACTL6U_19250 [Rhodovibrionaceae bacterium A322]
MDITLPDELLSADDINRFLKKLTVRCVWIGALALVSTSFFVA